MASPREPIREAHADSVPIYVRAEGAEYALVETSTDVAISTHPTPRAALMTALEIEAVAALVKRANLRTDGEPDGVWRWLDASAEEDEPTGDSRITAASLWEMAAALNARKSAIPINGGGAPSPDHAASEPHGDAYYGDGAHPANGWAHLGAIVLDGDGRTHLYLWSELLPEVAREVDRGRLAYGSICFAFESVDEADNFGVLGASLVSHALTNDPAVTTLTAGSERSVQPKFFATRSRKVDNMASKKTVFLDAFRAAARDASLPNGARIHAARAVLAAENVATRGALTDLYARIASLLGIEQADLMMNPWAVEDALCDLKRGAIAEARAGEEASEQPSEPPPAPPPPPPDPGTMAAQRARATREDAPAEGEQAADAPTPEEGAALLALARTIIGKPDATAADAIAELEATSEQLAAALGQDAPAQDDQQGDAPGGAAAESDTSTSTNAAVRALHALRKREADARAEAKKQAAELSAERAKVQRFETREWLDAEIAKRGLAVSPTERDELVSDALEHGRPVVEKILRAKNAPPSTNPLDRITERADRPKTRKQAIAAMRESARTELREKHKREDVPDAWVTSLAIRKAQDAFPELYAAEEAAN